MRIEQLDAVTVIRVPRVAQESIDIQACRDRTSLVSKGQNRKDAPVDERKRLLPLALCPHFYVAELLIFAVISGIALCLVRICFS